MFNELLLLLLLLLLNNLNHNHHFNHLLNQKKIAKTSATPGKTQLLNFFIIDEKFLLVDLPGYGFAKAPPGEVEKWSNAIDAYINNRPSLKLILLLVDCRRGPSEEDLTMMDWAEHKKIPLLLIYTKTDKLSNSEKMALMKKHPEAIPYSIMDTSSRHIVEKRIGQILWG